MPVPHFCVRSSCPNHFRPSRRWRVRFGSYHTLAHGRVQRYRCRACGATASDQSESLHYFAKCRLPLQAIWQSLVGGSSLREIARRYTVSPMAVQNALLRLGRQAMAAQLQLLAELPPRRQLVFDGLRSFVTSQDYPCDLTTVVDRPGEVVLSIVHTVFRRGGVMRPKQRRRMQAKNAVWRPRRGSMTADISLLTTEIWGYLRPRSPQEPGEIDTDFHPLYRRRLTADPVAAHYRRNELLRHIRTPAAAPRTIDNRLFPVNYIDRLLRHRLREHTRETIAFGRHACLQMHRAWVFAYDHNCRRPYRVKHPAIGMHAAQEAADPRWLTWVNRRFFTRRLRVHRLAVPETIRRVWMAELPTPPLRWRVGQKGSSVRIPAFARRELSGAHQHAP